MIIANKKSYADNIASTMDSILKDPEYKSIFTPSSVLEKLAINKRASEEQSDDNFQIEFEPEMQTVPLSAEASSPRADCIACGKTRQGWTEEMGLCKCMTSNGCDMLNGCKENCNCKCKVKTAGVSMNNVLIKSAFNALMKASSDLEEAGFDILSAHTLVLMDKLLVEAKAKKDNKKDDKKSKEKAKADKEKAKLKAEKDKNKAKDKLLKEKNKNKAKVEDKKKVKK